MQHDNFGSIYRGIITSNTGTGNEGGRCKIYVPGIYPRDFEKEPDALPWAEPATALFGGNFSGKEEAVKTGICGWPNVGAWVWVFFEQGLHMNPVYFAGIQGETGWSAENEKQWVMQSDRVKIQIDETDDVDRLTIVVKGKTNITIEGDQTVNISGAQDITAASTKINNPVTIEGTVDITGNVTIKGDLGVTGNINVTDGDVVADGISLKNHVHPITQPYGTPSLKPIAGA